MHFVSVCNNTSSIFCENFIDKLTIPGTSKIPSNMSMIHQQYTTIFYLCFINIYSTLPLHHHTSSIHKKYKKTPVTPHVYLFYNSSIIQQYMSFVSSLSISFNTLQQHFINSTPMFHQCLFVSSVYHKHYIKLSPMFHHFVNTSSVHSKTFYLST